MTNVEVVWRSDDIVARCIERHRPGPAEDMGPRLFASLPQRLKDIIHGIIVDGAWRSRCYARAPPSTTGPGPPAPGVAELHAQCFAFEMHELSGAGGPGAAAAALVAIKTKKMKSWAPPQFRIRSRFHWMPRMTRSRPRRYLRFRRPSHRAWGRTNR